MLLDAPCPWHRFFYAITPTLRAPRPLGLPIPFVRYYDGPIRHRLAVMTTNQGTADG